MTGGEGDRSGRSSRTARGPVTGWHAYGGSTDRHLAGREGVVAAQRDLEQLTGGSSPQDAVGHEGTKVADALYRLGRAYALDLHLPPRERFEAAYEAARQAVVAGKHAGSAAQRSQWATGLGSALKNRISLPGDPDAHSHNIEASLAAHATGLTLAREAGGEDLIAAAKAALGLAFFYRDLGTRSDNLDRAATLIKEAFEIRMSRGKKDDAAVIATTCGIILADEAGTPRNLDESTHWFRRARTLMDVDRLPAQARRLGRTAGVAAMRRKQWKEAADWYELARHAMLVCVERASELLDKRREVSEFGDASGRHVLSLALSGDLSSAIALADSYLRAISTPPPATSVTGGGCQVGSAPSVRCYLLASPVGSGALLSDDRPGRTNTLVFTENLTSTWLKTKMGWPLVPSGHGSHVTSRLVDENDLGDRELGVALVAAVSGALLRPLKHELDARRAPHAELVPFGVLVDAPLAGSWTYSNLGERDRARQWPTISVTPSAAQSPGSPSIAARAAKPRLVTVAVRTSESGDLHWTDVESLALEAAFPGAITALRGSEASMDNVLAAVDGATHVHLAGHGVFTHEDPDRTYFECSDGRLSIRKLLSHDLLRNTQLFVASACSLGTSDTFINPDQGFGLPRLLLDKYRCGLLAPIRPVHDIIAAVFTVRFGECLWRDGATSTAAAFSDTQAWFAEATYADLMNWAADHPTFGLEQIISDGHTWRERPEIWAPFTYFGR